MRAGHMVKPLGASCHSNNKWLALFATPLAPPVVPRRISTAMVLNNSQVDPSCFRIVQRCFDFTCLGQTLRILARFEVHRPTQATRAKSLQTIHSASDGELLFTSNLSKLRSKGACLIYMDTS